MKQLLLVWTDEDQLVTHELEVDIPMGYPQRVPDNAFVVDDKIASAKFSLGPMISVSVKKKDKNQEADELLDKFKKDLEELNK